jgi:hypothetical protein
MSQYNVSNTHSLIPNAREYMFQKKYISINANDRDIVKYPSSSSFEIELPQDYVNVQTVRISSWSFPSFYPTFSELKMNTNLLFNINNPYIPITTPPTDLQSAIYLGLTENIYDNYIASINEGCYTGSQMAIELTNAMNKDVTYYLVEYLQNNYPLLLVNFLQPSFGASGYTEFVVVFNEVSRKLSFGNKSSGFGIINNKQNYKYTILEKNTNCQNSKVSPSFANWGLPWYLGFDSQDYESELIVPYINSSIYNINMTPQLTYETNSSKKYWLEPYQKNSCVFVIECPLVINIDYDNDIFIEVSGLNALDETKPFQVSEFTKTTNGTVGVINSALAKVSINPNSINTQGQCQPIYKYYDPPAERIRRFCITLRYHDGRQVDFGNQDFNIMFELGLLTPHNEKRMHIQVPEAVKYFF